MRIGDRFTRNLGHTAAVGLTMCSCPVAPPYVTAKAQLQVESNSINYTEPVLHSTEHGPGQTPVVDTVLSAVKHAPRRQNIVVLRHI